MADCEENRWLLTMVRDAWNHYNRIKALVDGDDNERVTLETEVKHAADIATRLSTKQNEHIKTCPICSTPRPAL
jgi:hypothetical protein